MRYESDAEAIIKNKLQLQSMSSKNNHNLLMIKQR